MNLRDIVLLQLWQQFKNLAELRVFAKKCLASSDILVGWQLQVAAVTPPFSYFPSLYLSIQVLHPHNYLNQISTYF
jgi:hypothetical protein